MLKRNSLYFTSCFLILCQSWGCESPCVNASALAALVGYSDAESDTVIIRRFARASGFASPRDTVLLNRQHHHFNRRGDTLLILESTAAISSYFDYEFYLPVAQRVYRLNEIAEPQTSGRNHKTQCINPILSYRVNGQIVSGEDYYNIFYLRK